MYHLPVTHFTFFFFICRLTALDKCPGVHPIEVYEVARRIVAKAALYILRNDIQAVAGLHQLCAGQIAGVEATSCCEIFL